VLLVVVVLPVAVVLLPVSLLLVAVEHQHHLDRNTLTFHLQFLLQDFLDYHTNHRDHLL
jgi:hypothetical protein